MEDSTLRLSAIGLMLTLALGLGRLSVAAQTQPVGTVPRIGMLLAIAPRPSLPDWKQRLPLLQALRELGYVEGQTMAVEYRFAGGRYALLPELAADLVRL